MFGLPANQFHHVAASTRSSPPISFPTFHLLSSNPTSLGLDSRFSAQPSTLPLLRHPSAVKHGGKEDDAVDASFETEREGSSSREPVDPWAADEVIDVLGIRSSLEQAHGEPIWAHASRCSKQPEREDTSWKYKDENEEGNSRGTNLKVHTFYRNNEVGSELERVYQSNREKAEDMQITQNEKPKRGLEEDDAKDLNEELKTRSSREHHRKGIRWQIQKRDIHVFEEFYEEIFGRMMANQDAINNKLLQSLTKRDEDNAAREEAWKKTELDRINKELELRAQEQARVEDKQAAIVKLLEEFMHGSSNCDEFLMQVSSSVHASSNSVIFNQNPRLVRDTSDQSSETPTSSTVFHASQNPNGALPPDSAETRNCLSLVAQNFSSDYIDQATNISPAALPGKKITSSDRINCGKRWLRDEVLALINLRCRIHGNNNTDRVKTPLWEKISKEMLELGYTRSAKRCKEKWENINKYFRKTKNGNKKRSLDSRTCPYFHQLSTLYSEGMLSKSLEGNAKSLV